MKTGITGKETRKARAPKVPFPLRLDAELAARLRALKGKPGITMNELIEDALREKLDTIATHKLHDNARAIQAELHRINSPSRDAGSPDTPNTAGSGLVMLPRKGQRRGGARRKR